MKNKEQELKELENSTLKKREAIITKWEVLEVFGNSIDKYEAPHVHTTTLYGTAGLIHFARCDYESIRSGKNPDKELLRFLLEKYPPVNILKVKEFGTTSFRPESTITDVSEDLLYECFGVVVDVYPHGYPGIPNGRCKAKWTTVIRDKMWRMEVDTPFYNKLGKYIVKFESKETYLGRPNRIIECDFKPNFDGQRVRWATGDYVNNTPNHFTVYWDRDTGKSLNLPEILFEKEVRDER